MDLFEFLLKWLPSIGSGVMAFIMFLIKKGYIEKWFMKEPKNIWILKKNDIHYLLNHNFFDSISKVLSYKLKKLYDSSDKSNENFVFYSQLKIKYSLIFSETHDFIKNLNIKEHYNRNSVTILLMYFVQNLIEKINLKWSENNIEISEIEDFNKWHQIHVDLFQNSIEGSVQDSENIFSAFRDFLECFKIVMNSTFQDASFIFKNGIIYKNIITDQQITNIKLKLK